MTLHERATLLTDCLLAAFAAWLPWRLPRAVPVVNRAVRWWRGGVVLTAASAPFGAGYHGFAPNFSAPAAAVGCRFTLVTIDLLSAAMAMTLVYEIAAPSRHRLLFAVAAICRPEFVVAIADYGSTMLAWIAVVVVLCRPWRGLMLTALALSTLAALVQQFHWVPATWLLIGIC